MRKLLLVATAALVASCATTAYRAGDPCVTDGFTVIDGFVGARRGTCTVVSGNKVQLDIVPESSGYINDSPWFAFRIQPNGAREALISLRYNGGHHRYRPKTSVDGKRWEALDDVYVSTAPDGRRTDITVPLGDVPVWVAAQELVTPSDYAAWNRSIADSSGICLRELGKSKAGRPISVFDSNPDAKDVLVLIGRQHPPEVSGAFAFFAFAETVFGDTALAREFRNRYRVIAVPLLNPDGVAAGNWRHNLGHTDINRDWGPFAQPETQLIARILDDLDAGGSKLRVFLDFHSTKKNVFYTQQRPTSPPGFTHAWLASARPRIQDYPFSNDAGPADNLTAARNYVYERYGIPSVTYEVGDETDRDAVRAAARIFAEELMALMLEQAY